MSQAGTAATAVAYKHKPLMVALLMPRYVKLPYLVQAMLVIVASAGDCERQARVLHVAKIPFLCSSPWLTLAR